MAVGTINYPASLDTAVELIQAANNAADTLFAAIGTSNTSLQLLDSTEFADSGIVAIGTELISYTAKSGNLLTGLTRGVEGTVAASHATGATVSQVITAGSHNVLASAILALEAKLGIGTDIAWSKMAPLTVNRLLVSDSGGDVAVSAITHDATNAILGNVGSLDFDTTPSGANQAARIQWNDTDGTLNVGLKGGSIPLHVGLQQFVRIVNKTGGALTKSGFKVIRAGASSGVNRIGGYLAQANTEANSTDILGLVAEDISQNQEGFVASSGEIHNIDTTGSNGETWAEGDVLYLSPTIAGALTNVRPQAPNHLVIIGYVISRNANNGRILVHLQSSWETAELHDVKITGTPTAGSLLIRNATTGVWENARLTAGANVSITNADAAITIAAGAPMVYPGAGVPVSTGSAWGTSKTSPSGDIVGATDSQVLTNKTINGANNTLSNVNLASQVTGTLPVANGGTGATTAAGALSSLGAYPASNPSGYLTGNQVVSLSGDVTGSGATSIAATISNAAVTNAKMANMAASTIKANVTGSSAAPQDASLSSVLDLVGSATQGDLLYRGSSSWTRLPVGTEGQGLLVVGGVPAWNETNGTFRNVLINGDFSICQRSLWSTPFFNQSSSPAFTLNNAYTIDRWYLAMDGNYMADVAQSTADSPVNQLYSCKLTAGTANTTGKKFGIAQVVEARNCVGLIGSTATLSAKIKVSNASRVSDVRMAVIGWSGTADGLLRNFISGGAWQAAGTNPTYGTSWANLNTPANLSATTSWATYSTTVSVPSTVKNLAVFIWSNGSSVLTGDSLFITDVQLQAGKLTPFERVPVDVQQQRCDWYCQALYPSSDYTPSSGTLQAPRRGYPFGSGFWNSRVSSQGVTYVVFEACVMYRNTMRAIPSAKISAGSTFYVFSRTGGATGIGVGVEVESLSRMSTYLTVSVYSIPATNVYANNGAPGILTGNTFPDTPAYILLDAEM